MRSLSCALLVTAGFTLSACHPTNTPTPSGTVKGVAAAVEAGSSPAGPGATSRDDSSSIAVANAASAAIAAQTGSGASPSASRP